MALRELVRTLRQMLTDALPNADEDVRKRWACRLWVLRCMAAHGIWTDGAPLPAGLALFDGASALPPALADAMAYLRAFSDTRWRDPGLPGRLLQLWQQPERERVFAGMRGRRPAESIPAVTQVFTPDWLVQCMVQNALAVSVAAPDAWQYALPAPSAGRVPADLTVLDPCMGAGHVLLYAFDALHERLCAAGADPADAARHVLTAQLFGLDIDPTAAQVAVCGLYCKAAPYLPDILAELPPVHLYDFSGTEDAPGFADAALCGALLTPPAGGTGKAAAIADLLHRRYRAVVTNPPYMSSSGMPPVLRQFVRAAWPEGRADLYAAFLLRCADLTAEDGAFSLLVQHGWMFLSRFEALRARLRPYTVQSLVHLGSHAFGAGDVGTIVQTAVVTCLGRTCPQYPTTWVDLTRQTDKAAAFADPALRRTRPVETFAPAPGDPLRYTADARMLALLDMPRLGDVYRICQGMTTSDNARFLRRWYEVPPGSIAFGCRDAAAAAATGKRWFPYNKGGRLRRWYGNQSWVVDYQDDGAAMRALHAALSRDHPGGRLKNADCYFKSAVTWPFISDSKRFGVRWQEPGTLFDVSGSCLFPPEEDRLYVMALLSSPVALAYLALFNPTLNVQAKDIKSIPLLMDTARRPEIEALAEGLIAMARADWDLDEESWGYTCHPLLTTGAATLPDAWARHAAACADRAAAMQRGEARLGRLFAEIYGLEDVLDMTPPPLTLRPCTPAGAAAGLVRFAVGCSLGRFSFGDRETLPFLPLDAVPGEAARLLAAAFGEDAVPAGMTWLDEALGMPLAAWCRTHLWHDICRTYHKRPVYWLAVSGRRRTLCGLVYVHRMPARPVRLLQDIAAGMPQTAELRDYQERLAAAADLVRDPEESLPVSLARFQGIFAAPR